MREDALKAILNRIHPTEDSLLDEYLDLWHSVEYKRKAFITREGQTERYLYFVEEGVQKSYFLKDGKEYIIAFSYTGNFSGSPKSLFTQSPSDVFIECITPSRFLRVPYDDHLRMLGEHPALNTMFRRSAELILAGVISRYQELMSHTIEERFRSFARRSPHLLNLVPHKDMASYLRIDATNFSKLINSVKV